MIYELKQYSCDKCGCLSDFLDPDAPLPQGWVSLSSFTHYCQECYNKIKTIKTMSDETKQLIKDLYEGGMNPEDIADELGLDECEVIDYCAELL